VVTGTSANVTYSPAGSSHAGKVPMHITGKLHNAVFYSITAQLNGSGTVRCKILVDHKVISSAAARGAQHRLVRDQQGPAVGEVGEHQ